MPLLEVPSLGFCGNGSQQVKLDAGTSYRLRAGILLLASESTAREPCPALYRELVRHSASFADRFLVTLNRVSRARSPNRAVFASGLRVLNLRFPFED